MALKDKYWYNFAMKYYTVMKKNKLLIYAITWMNVIDILLNDRSQTRKDSQCMIPIPVEF